MYYLTRNKIKVTKLLYLQLLGKFAKMAAAINRICILKPLGTGHRNIQLQSGKNIIGRSRETNIRDAGCSKQQLELNVNLQACTIDMQVLGANPSSVNGAMAMQHSKCTLEHGDIIEMVYGRHEFEVVFKPPPTKNNEQVANKVSKLMLADTWHSLNNGEVLIYSSAGVRASEKIAAYDLDWTIIKTRSGNVFPKRNDDWELLYPHIPIKLKNLYDIGFKICIFTNQGGIGIGKLTTIEFKQKISDVLNKLGVPVQIFAATTKGHYRKPLIGMWLYMRDFMNEQVPLQLEKCFYVGDAAGRDETMRGINKSRKDHSLVDRLFAANIGISFYTPEVHFLAHREEPWIRPSFEPMSLNKDMALLDPADTELPKKLELILMVGLPGSGKSHFCRQYLVPHGYIVANGDTLGGTTNCIILCEKTLRKKQSCVIDNTNVSIEARSKFIEIAKKLSVPCRCFVMNLTDVHNKHNIAFRDLTDVSHLTVNNMALMGMKKRYLSPTLAEGFDAVVKVNWKPKFTNKIHEQLYQMYLLEK